MRTDRSAPEQTLEEELAGELRRAGLADRQSQAVAMRLGWDGKGGTTLEIAGDAVGLTRERVRQLVRQVARHLTTTEPSLPALEAAVEALEQIAPARRNEAAARLAAAGLARADFDPAGVLEAAQMAGLRSKLAVAGDFVLTDGQAEVANSVLETARKLVSHNGAGDIGTLVDTLAEPDVNELAARRFLEIDDDIVWLDDDRGWFFLPTGRNRAVNYLRKMLSVSPSLTLTDVRDGLRRPARSVRLPRGVVRGLCEQLDWIEVASDVVTITVSLDFRRVLENTEETLVDVFTEHGPVLDRATAIDVAEQYGLDRTTAGLYLGWSPVIERLAINRYALRGADVPAGTLEAMSGADRRRRVQQGHGWTRDGRLWIGYTLSRAVIDTNVVGVPAALREELRGRYAVRPVDEHLGEVATDGQNLWGLSRVLRRNGAEPGDVLVIEFDLARHECVAYVGGSELLDPENRSTAEVDSASVANGPDEGGLEALLPPQGGFFEEQPTLHPHPTADPTDVAEQARRGPSNLGMHGNPADLPPQPAAAPLAVATSESGSTEHPQVVQVLLDRLETTVEPLAQRPSAEAGPELTVTQPAEMCVVPGCGRPGKNKLGVRCRVWHEPSPVPGKKKTSALWAPDADAFLCDEHALGGAHITLIFEPDDSCETAVRVIAAPQAEARTRPIKGVPSEITQADEGD